MSGSLHERLARIAALSVAMTLVACVGPSIEDEIPLPELAGVESPIVKAVRAARKAVRRNPESAEAWGGLGDRYYVHDWFHEAAECYRRAANLEPWKFDWSYRLGQTLFEVNDMEGAREAFSRALPRQSSYAPAHVIYAEVLVRLGRADEARVHYMKASFLDPTNSHSMLGLGQLAISAGRFEEARQHLEEALRRNPRHTEVHQALAQVHVALGDEAQAGFHIARTRSLPKSTPKPDPRAVPDVEPAGSQAYNLRGAALDRQGRLREAEAEFRKALRINPAYTTARYNLGTVLARQGRLEQAIEQLSEVVRVRPSHPDARVNLGLALGQLGRMSKAEDQFRQALAVNPDHAKAHTGLGNLLSTRGETGEAAEHYREALRVAPDLLEAARRLAWLLATGEDSALRDGAEAVRLAEQVCRQTENRDSLGLDVLAAAYAEVGRFDDAVSVASKAASLAASAGRADLAEALRSRLRLYESGRPYRE